MLTAQTKRQLDTALGLLGPAAGDEIEALISGDVPGTTYYVDGTNGNNGESRDGKSWRSSVATIGRAITLASAKDVIKVAPGAYDETVTVSKALTIIGVGPKGSVYIEPSTAGAEGMQVTADDVTLINIGVAGDSAADYALNVNACARFRSYGGKFEGPNGTVILLNGSASDQAADVMFYKPEICWGGTGIVLDDSAYGYPTQIRVIEPLFHNLTVAHIGLASGGGVANLWVEDPIHDNAEDATEPTDYIVVNRVGDTGVILRPAFATNTLDSAKVTLATGVRIIDWHTEQEGAPATGGTSGRPD